MNKLLNVAFAIGLALTGTSAVMADKPATPAMVTINQLPTLKQEPQHSTGVNVSPLVLNVPTIVNSR